ncbi:MAG: hypothetical protein ACE5HV_17105 [Acidobacteriota bacterium]
MILIRDIKDQVKDRMEKAKDAKITEAGDSLIERISAIEEELYQVRNRSRQDPLNFPIHLSHQRRDCRSITVDSPSTYRGERPGRRPRGPLQEGLVLPRP